MFATYFNSRKTLAIYYQLEKYLKDRLEYRRGENDHTYRGKKNDMADTVLMPGDPLKTKWAAKNFLSNAKEINTVRGMLGYTGTWKKNKVTIHGSGMKCYSQFM